MKWSHYEQIKQIFLRNKIAGSLPCARASQRIPIASDFTNVSIWQGWVYAAFVIDLFARRIVGWRVSFSMQTVLRSTR